MNSERRARVVCTLFCVHPPRALNVHRDTGPTVSSMNLEATLSPSACVQTFARLRQGAAGPTCTSSIHAALTAAALDKP